MSDQSRAQRHIFFAERAAAKIDGVSPEARPRPVARVGIVGAGAMGGGIAMNVLTAGIPVTLLEMKQEALDRGLATIASEQEIVERTLYTMVNEGALILAEKIAQRASDIDVVWIYGYGWPVYRGARCSGPTRWASAPSSPAWKSKASRSPRFCAKWPPAETGSTADGQDRR